MAIGGDGAPGSGCLFLISFLNVGERICSSSENFLLFGANVAENSFIIRKFLMKLIADLHFLESKVFIITIKEKQYKVEFKVSEFPNDLKMLAFLAGELSNAAYYFSTFGTVNKDDANDYKKEYGVTKTADWKPFLYQKRIADVDKVQKKKKELALSKSSGATKRQNLTAYISKTLKSRQEEVPLIGKFVDLAKAEPLHLKNNVTKEMFVKLLKICTAQSNLGSIKAYKAQNQSFS